ncbi:MAG TPA: magnesium/cobalt transporter CorA [Sulfuricurvum sp.]|nr:MAG: magnesium and cobalt transport protein CorA [Campylobacterales bacterium 16-40-21]HQS66782.1 magnesium/cobalt transporter CorA [Sulfuricurvum sp.]HQT36943.1 magnesium/cobalt transporter CorA [Sulfuricurvum sp.]
MIKCFVKNDHAIALIDTMSDLDGDVIDRVIWVDMLMPTHDEIIFIENTFGIKFPTKQETEEIEISSRYWEENDKIEINSYFLISSNQNSFNETVSFILYREMLISIRYAALYTFEEFNRKVYATPQQFDSGYDVFCNLLDIRIDADADIIEKLSRDIARIRKHVFTDYKNDDEEILERISSFEDLNMQIRESLTDKQRILSSFLKSDKYKPSLKNDVTIMLKDIKSLVDYTDFNFQRLDYLQNVFVGLLSIQQNKVIKIFTIVNVIFLPPTLIASIYGMNFQIMPELSWGYGYGLSIIMMICSSILPIYIFKRKGLI